MDADPDWRPRVHTRECPHGLSARYVTNGSDLYYVLEVIEGLVCLEDCHSLQEFLVSIEDARALHPVGT